MDNSLRGRIIPELRSRWFWVVGVLGVALVLTALDPRDTSGSGYIAYLLLLLVLSVLMLLAWQAASGFSKPDWLFPAVIVAFLLRLGVGVGLTLTLPTWGYSDNLPHRAGYIYSDAYTRDVDAWNLARSEEPLLSAWQDPSLSDQYGGLLFLSASVYRILSPAVRRPFLVILLTAAVGAMTVLFTWSFTRRAFGRSAAAIASWMVTLYPEVLVLGGSQMREPFLMLATAMLLDGYSRIRVMELRKGWVEIVLAALLALFLSPPYSLVVVGSVVVMWLWEGKGGERQNRWALGLLLVLIFAGGALTVRSWSGIEGRPESNNILDLLIWWSSGGASFQLQLLEDSSGWVQKIFAIAPEWSQMPLATMYGLIQPFLPAAVMDSTSAPLIRVIVSLRALGWFFSIPFLLYAPILALREKGRRGLVTFLSLAFWIVILLVSYRDAGRMWDNPRWRAIFISVQAAVIGWTWITSLRRANPWIGRFAVIVGFSTLAFLQWEAGRYYGLPRLNLWETLGLVTGFGALYLIGTLANDNLRKRKLITR